MMAKKKWPPLESYKIPKTDWPKVTVAEARKMGIIPVELLSDPGYVMLDVMTGEPRSVEDFEYNGD
jgi:hypothetical protein